METTYTMIGADGLQYGPITLEQLRAWIGDGRITGGTKVLRSDTNVWLSAAQYVELGLAPVAVTLKPPSATPQAAQDPAILRRARAGAGWFFIIAVFSLVNTFMAMSHQGTFFLVGLGVNLMVPNLVTSVIISGIFALFGVFARKGQSWSFIAGMILYGLDALIFVQASMWLPVAFHAYALFRIFMGLLASKQLKAQAR